MSKQDIRQAKWEMRNLADLTNWDNNPRSILKEDFERLQGQIKKLGVHNGLLVNQDNIVLGGNMRLRAFKELSKTYNLDQVMCRIIETKDEAEMLEFALSDNDQMGTTDDLKLAEVFALHPIETKLYKIQSNVLRPLESIINPPDPSTLGGGDDEDQNPMDERLETYLGGNIKQIVLYYATDEYERRITQLQEIGTDLGLDNNTDIISKLIEEYHAGIVADKTAS